MATLTTFTAGTPILSADVNANFAALNTDLDTSVRIGYATATLATNSGTGTDDLHSWTMPAGTLADIGDGLVIHTRFYCDANANSKLIEFKLGSGTAITLNSTTAPNNKYLLVSLVCMVATLSGGSQWYVQGTPILTAGSFDTPAFESAVSLSSPVAGSLASSMVVKFTGTATATGDIQQQFTLIQTFKAP